MKLNKKIEEKIVLNLIVNARKAWKKWETAMRKLYEMDPVASHELRNEFYERRCQ